MNRIAIATLGVLALLAISAVCFVSVRGRMERDLTARSQSALADARIDWARVQARGRELTLSGVAPNAAEQARASRVVAAVWGVGALRNQIELAPPEDIATTEPGAEAEGVPPPVLAGPACDQADRVLAELPPIRFDVGSTVLDAESYGTLDRAVELLDCPGVRIELVGHADSQGPRQMNLELSRWRAESAWEYMVSRGVDGDRIDVRAAGESEPVAPNTSADGRALNRRLELRGG
jgi:outer membrane protein OmpA-like peptidoglycan-associated protein